MDSVICFPYCYIFRQLGSLSWLKVTTHVPSSPSSVYLWSIRSPCPIRSLCQSKKPTAKKNNNDHSCCWHALLCQFRHNKFTCVVCFFSRDSRSTNYNFRLRKWTYFLLPDTQGTILRALIQEVSFFSRYTPPWSYDHKCGSLAAAAFAEYFYAKARQGVPQRLLPPANHLILYLWCHTIGSLPRSQMVCYQSPPPAMSDCVEGADPLRGRVLRPPRRIVD